jgi:hypothetical protein
MVIVKRFYWLSLLCLSAFPIYGQELCATRCNQRNSECLKACVGDPREAKKPGRGELMISCLKSCRAQADPCRAQCRAKPSPAPPPRSD